MDMHCFGRIIGTTLNSELLFFNGIREVWTLIIWLTIMPSTPSVCAALYFNDL